MNLRVTFRSNLAMLRMKKSGQGANESIKVVRKHFQEMMFLKAAEVGQTSESTSSMELVIFVRSFHSLLLRLIADSFCQNC